MSWCWPITRHSTFASRVIWVEKFERSSGAIKRLNAHLERLRELAHSFSFAMRSLYSLVLLSLNIAYAAAAVSISATTKASTTAVPTSTVLSTSTFTTYTNTTSTITSTSTFTNSSSTASPTQTSSTSVYCDLPAPTSGTQVKFAGINIAGIDFSIDEYGNYDPTLAIPPLTAYGGADGLGQMQHFVKDDRFNIFRLPVTWQFLTGGTPGGAFDPTNFAEYNTLVKSCLSTGAYCIIDLHNYAYFYGGVS